MSLQTIRFYRTLALARAPPPLASFVSHLPAAPKTGGLEQPFNLAAYPTTTFLRPNPFLNLP